VLDRTGQSGTDLVLRDFTSRQCHGYSMVGLEKGNKSLPVCMSRNFLGSLTTNDARWTREIKFRIAMAKEALKQEEDYF